MWRRYFLLITILLLGWPVGLRAEVSSVEILRVAFGSCNRHDLPQPIWRGVEAFQPQIWIWLGDNIYGDSYDPKVLEAKWRAQKAREDYKEAMRGVIVTGIWDDHDYGVNDGGKDYPLKAESQKLFLDFLDVSKDDPRRQRSGIYGSQVFGMPGRQICLVLLDVRTHRDAPRTGGDILGEEQWRWLEEVFERSRANIHLIASGTQVLPSEHRFEKWADYPEARERLLELLEKYSVANPIFLTGDRHHAEISCLPGRGGRPDVFEVTASGMTHSLSRNLDEPNSLRVGKGFGGLNFGTIEVDWDSARATLAIRDQEGRLVNSAEVALGLGPTTKGAKR